MKRGRPISFDIEKSADMYKNGIPIQEIANNFNISATTIYNGLNKSKINPNRQNKVDYKKAEKLYNRGKSVKELSEIFNVTKAAIYEGFRKKGIVSNFDRAQAILREPTQKQLIYFAGLFDGEGSINILHKKPRYFSLNIAITNTNIQVINWLKYNFNGHIRISNKQNLKHKTTYNWTSTSIQARKLLEQSLPYLIIKKEQAIIAIEFQKRFYRCNTITNKEIQRRFEFKNRIESMR